MSSVLLTPRQAADALGASESSVRRWCDQGRIPGEKTAGGHRRIRLSALMEFAREQGIRLSVAAAQGARAHGGKTASTAELCRRVQTALLTEDTEAVLALVGDQLSGSGIAPICDDILAPTMADIGEGWAAGRLDIYQEHRATQSLVQVLSRVAELLPRVDDGAPKSLCCSLAGDSYSIAPRMASLVTRSVGFAPALIGPETPAESVIRAMKDLKPRLAVLSLSHAPTQKQLVGEFRRVYEAAREFGVAVAAGGRALTPAVRRAVDADFFGDTMVHLQGFAARLRDR